MASETKIQQFVHRLEEGGWVRRFKVIVVMSAVANLNYLWFFKEGNGFKGLAHEKAIEQAQIARELSRGNGFSTKMIRPAAIWQFERSLGAFPLEKTPDTYHAPLNPFLNSLVFRGMDALNVGVKGVAKKAEFFKNYTYENTMNSKLIVYSYDRIIAFVQVVCFLLAVAVTYFTIRRLFDDRLAVFTAGLMLICQQFWDYAMTGLPQMLMLLISRGAVYLLVRAVEAKTLGAKPLPWLAGAAGLYGLLALTHGLTLWIFAGALFFAFFYFRPRGRDAAIIFGIVLLCYGPWLVRNYMVCGSPVGLGWYSGLYQVRGTESQIMRSTDVPLSGVSPTVFRNKFQGQILYQLDNIYDFLGSSLLAPVFFIALLPLFKRPETAHFRWCVLSMWLFAVFGMAVFGMPEAGTNMRANDLHVLFIPVMIAYGLAFVLVMWSRLEIHIRLVRVAFLGMLFVVSGLSFIQQFLLLVGPPTGRVQWPPYVPPYIAILGQWTRPEEIIASDMPWAVAWYADRKSLWLPLSIRDFLQFNDFRDLKGQIVGIYLTPVTGNRAFISEVVKGEYKDWAPFIMRNVNTKEFPLKAVTALPIDGECVYYSDRDRWTNRED